MVAPFHDRVKRIFYEASQRAPGERPAFLEEACHGAKDVRAEVESLLAFHGEGSAPPASTQRGRPSRAPRHFETGRVVGRRYRIDALLGWGGVGEVYRAWDRSLEMMVALKVLIVANPFARAELMREVRVARQVTHPAVCRVYDIAEEEREPFITMEWIDGERLDTLLGRHGSLAPARALDVGRQICAGVAAAHEKGIVHRDLKPGNILVDRQGGAHVMDFGTAVATERPTLRDLLPIGTPRYMAPEQLREGGAVSTRTDVHALGLVLREMLTGVRPRPGRLPAKLRLLLPTLEPWLDAVIQRALSADPEERYPSAVELGHALAEGASEDAWCLFRAPPCECPAWKSGKGLSGQLASGTERVGRDRALPCEGLGSSRLQLP